MKEGFKGALLGFALGISLAIVATLIVAYIAKNAYNKNISVSFYIETGTFVALITALSGWIYKEWGGIKTTINGKADKSYVDTRIGVLETAIDERKDLEHDYREEIKCQLDQIQKSQDKLETRFDKFNENTLDLMKNMYQAIESIKFGV